MHRPVTITRRRLVGALVRGGLLALFTGGCSVLDRGVDLLPSAPKLDVAILPTRQEEKPQPRATAVPPDSLPLAKAYLAAWSGKRYHEMYEVLAAASRAAHPQDRFVRRYQTIKEVGTIESWEAEVIGDPQPPEEPPPPDAPVTVEVPFRLRVRTSLAGEFEQENRLKLVFENGTWRVAWSPSSIFKELKDDYLVHLFPDIPPRGSILDRKGRPLATQDVVLEVGVVPGELAEEDRALGVLGDLLGSPAEAIKERYAKAEPHWWVPLREFPASEREAVTSKVKDVPGVQIREKPARVYPNGPTAAHVIGYVSRVTAEELQELAPKGYQETDVVGRAGIEGWGEKILAGERGGRLAVITSAGRVVKVLSERPSVPGNNVVLTIDVEVQRLAEEAFGDRTGSVVVLDPRDNSVLALVSSPRFDPNKFVLGFTTEEWEQLSNDPRLPFQNRPVQSAYPTGSVFKVITALTGLERGGFSPGTTFRCGGSWRGLPGVVFGDWLPGGHGTLSLVEGITQSCNIVFYEIGKRLDEIDPHI
ncbi:MAG TPA: penicillin-binding transpeptidase domain-containing protein, partial [Chloroflexota bacterium]